MLPPIPTALPPRCEWPECTYLRCAVDGYHQATILILPVPGDMLGSINVRWDDDEADAYWHRYVGERWTYYLALPADPPVEIARHVAAAWDLLAKHTPARELVSAR